MSTNRLFVLAAATALVAWSTAPGCFPDSWRADAKASVKTDEKATPGPGATAELPGSAPGASASASGRSGQQGPRESKLEVRP